MQECWFITGLVLGIVYVACQVVNARTAHKVAESTRNLLDLQIEAIRKEL